MAANLLGSAFNIWYNATRIEQMLSEAQLNRFHDCWMVFNVIIYPTAAFLWVIPLVWLKPMHRAQLAGEEIDAEKLTRAQRTVVNLPWRILVVASASWLLCIPVFLTALMAIDEPLSMDVVWHLITAFVTGGLIAITHSFFAVELVSQRTLFPVFFRRENPAETPGAMPLTLTARGIMWAVSAVVSPVVTLVLLLISPDTSQLSPWFGVAVGVVAVAFGLMTAWMLGRLVADPVHQLKDAAIRVSEGDLNVRVNLLRADDFGPLIEKFNLMVEGLRERERLQETFGRHVGREAAEQILQQGDGLGGSQLTITVMFVDVRNFTAHSADHSPEEVVSALNIFFRDAVEMVETHGGMVNKFLGDGFMALFGAIQLGSRAANTSHAHDAVETGRLLLCCLNEAAQELEQAGWPGLKIGIGINTGPAIVGSIGSPKRQEFTAIGDTVNVAARVEALTKQVRHDLLVTEATRQHLPDDISLTPLPPQHVKGKSAALQVYAVDT